MAEFKYCNYPLNDFDGYIPYIVTGKITKDDVAAINNDSNKKLLILKNTVNQDSQIIGKISKEKALFSVLGGLDYLQKNKYRHPHYLKRTINSPKVLSEIIKLFEQIESKLRPFWNDTEKCLYVYKTLVEKCHYQYDGEAENETLDGNDYKVIKSLSGLLFDRLVCVGFALAFKEEMDRLGIPCYYQSYQNHHAWNVVKLEGAYRGIDLTWDCYHKKNNKCTFNYFGRTPKFYENKHHCLDNEPEERKFNLVPFQDEELKSHLKNIGEELVKTFPLKTFENIKGETIKYYNVVEEDYTKYYIDFFGKLVVVYLQDQIMPDSGLTIENIEKALTNDGFIGLKPENKTPDYNLYQRSDGSTFLISKEFNHQKNVAEFCYLDIVNQNNANQIRRSFILSENNLAEITDETIKLYIADELLSKKRLESKLKDFNGYVGYIGQDYKKHYSPKFEQELNIQGHRR